MDLRTLNLKPEQVDRLKAVLNYQPFILSDDIRTGVGYSWLYQSEGGRNAGLADFVKNRAETDASVWANFVDANQRLAAMYQDYIDAICRAFPDRGLSVLDVACNNGYFLVEFSARGYKTCIGADRANYSAAIAELNSVLGTRARFWPRHYCSWVHTFKSNRIAGGLQRLFGYERNYWNRLHDAGALLCPEPSFDITIASQIYQHISDPLYFIAFLGRITRKALLFFGGMGDDPKFRVGYSKPNRFDSTKRFPVNFDNDVGLSRIFLYECLKLAGFQEIIVLPYDEQRHLPPSWMGTQQALLCIKNSGDS